VREGKGKIFLENQCDTANQKERRREAKKHKKNAPRRDTERRH
jgi:hypothetical protein